MAVALFRQRSEADMALILQTPALNSNKGWVQVLHSRRRDGKRTLCGARSRAVHCFRPS